MIDFVTGRVARVSAAEVVVQTGGVGLLLRCPPQTLASLRVGETVQLATSLVVREDSFTLFGFVDEDGRDCFDQVQTVSGIGPRTALALLSVLAPDDLRSAVAGEDVAALTRVPGIGKKGAQRLLLELKDKIGSPVGSGITPLPAGSVADGGWQQQVHQALLGLGWAPRDAETATAAVRPLAENGEPVAVLLRAALQQLDRAS